MLTRGIRLNDLVGRRFVVGEVECVGEELCEPCNHLQGLTRPGVLSGMVHRAGLRADIVQRRAHRRRRRGGRGRPMAELIEVPSGLEGVIAFDTAIAEPDKEGNALRYRGVDIEELVGRVPFERVWGLLVDGSYEPGMPPAEPHPLAVRTGDPRADLQAALAMLAPEWGLRELIDITDEQARAGPGAGVGDGALVRRPVRARRGATAGPAGGDRQGVLDTRAVPDPLARRGRPPARARRSTPTGSRPPSTA